MIRRLLIVSAVFPALVLAGFAHAGQDLPDPAKLKLASANALVVGADDGQLVYAKAANDVTPIASLTKLMTAMVVLDAALPMDEMLDVDLDDLDYLKGSSSRLRMGATLPRREMLRLALMSSENRAASSLARHYPGGGASFVAAMNIKARQLGMERTRFEDATGLSPRNVSTANDLARMVRAAASYPLIRDYSITPEHVVEIETTGQTLGFNNSNALVKNDDWDIRLQKTGYIREAGRCVVMLTRIGNRPMVIVLLDSIGRYTRLGDAQRVKHWLETGEGLDIPVVARAAKTVRMAAARRGVQAKGTSRAAVATAPAKKQVKGTLAPRIANASKARGA